MLIYVMIVVILILCCVRLIKWIVFSATELVHLFYLSPVVVCTGIVKRINLWNILILHITIKSIKQHLILVHWIQFASLENGGWCAINLIHHIQCNSLCVCPWLRSLAELRMARWSQVWASSYLWSVFINWRVLDQERICEIASIVRAAQWILSLHCFSVLNASLLGCTQISLFFIFLLLIKVS